MSQTHLWKIIQFIIYQITQVKVTITLSLKVVKWLNQEDRAE